MAEGKLNPREQARLEEQKKSRKTRMKYVAVAVALFLMVALVVFVNSSLFTDGLAALKVGDTGYSVADVNYEYQSSYRQLLSTYGDYISIFLDPEKPLDEQQCAMMSDGGTWDDYFKDMADSSLVEKTAYSAAAKAAGYTLTDDERAQIDSIVSSYSVYGSMYGYDTDAYIAASFGAGNNEKTLRRHLESDLVNERYLDDLLASYSFTAEEKDAYYAEHKDNLDTVDYLYAYVAAEEGKDAGETARSILESMDGTDEAAFRAAALAVTGSEATKTTVSKSTDNASDEEIREGAVFTHDSGSGWYALYVLGIEDNSYHTVSVRHILIKAQDADGDGSVSDDEKAASLAAVTALRDSWLAGDATEDSFAELAREQSEDEGSAENGGLYENIHKGQMVEQFDAFCFEDHEYGDTGLVYGESAGYAGYHVMFYVEKLPAREAAARDDLRNEALTEWSTEITEGLEPVRRWAYKLVG